MRARALLVCTLPLISIAASAASYQTLHHFTGLSLSYRSMERACRV